jgi:hypothetical protein
MCNLDRVVDIGDDSPTIRAGKMSVGAEIWKQFIDAGCFDDRTIGGVPATS